MAYRAEIEIGVKGTEKLRDLRNTIEDLSSKVNKLDELANVFQAPIQSVLNYAKSVQIATAALNKAELGSRDEADAIKAVATAIAEENAVRQRKLFLLDTEIRKQQGLLRAAPTTGTIELGPGGPGFSGGFTAGQRQLANEQAILRTREVENKARRETLQIISREELFELKLQKILERNAQLVEQRNAVGKLAKKGISSAAIGGAFPLLFGQGGAAATGGAIGGLLGEAIPGVGGFGGSLIGTLIGEKIGQGNKVKELAADIGFSAEQTRLLGTAFKQAGQDFDKFQQSVQNIRGLSLSIEDQAKAIQLVSTLTATYGGQIDKVTNALTSSLEAGKVSQATLNQLTSQGIPIQQALADKYKINRDAVLQYAKDGKISVQDLIDTLVDVGNKGSASAKVQKDAFNDSFNQINAAVTEFQTTVSESFKQTADALRIDLGGAIQAVTSYLVDLINGFSALAKVASILDPIISAYINLEKAIFNAVKAVPALRDAIVSFALTALGPLQGVVVLLNQIRGLGAATKGKEKQGPYVPERLTRKSLQSFIAPSQFASGGGGGASKAARDAARLAEQTKKQLDDAFKLNELAKSRLEIQVAVSDEEKLESEFSKIAVERRIKFLELQKNAKSEKERELLISAQISTIAADNKAYEQKKQELLAQQNKELFNQIGLADVLNKKLQGGLAGAFTNGSATGNFRTDVNLLPSITGGPLSQEFEDIKKRLAELNDPVNQIKSAADSISTAFSQSFKDIITGATSAQEALANFFNSIASSFADLAAELIKEYIKLQIIGLIKNFFPGGGLVGATNFSGVFSNPTAATGFNAGVFGGPSLLSGRASGGPVSANTPYIVGEKGPELFMPRNSGTIIPNNAMGGGSTNVVVNVDASGSSVQGDQQQARQLGVAVSAAVQAELVKQQRPGGLLAGTRR